MQHDYNKKWSEILDLKNEIEQLNLSISGVRLSIAYSKNKNHTAKLKQKEVMLNKRLKILQDRKKRFEKEYSIMYKAERRYKW